MKCTTCGSIEFDADGVCKGCGVKMTDAEASASAASPAATPTAPASADTGTGNDLHAEVQDCPGCTAPRKQPPARFCHACGWDFRDMKPGRAKIRNAPAPAAAPVPAVGGDSLAPGTTPGAPTAPAIEEPATAMRAVVSVDGAHLEWCKKHYDGLEDLVLPNPLPSAELFSLSGKVVVIGRLSNKNRVQPAIQCNDDTGVSKHHCKLVLQADGTYGVFDGPEPKGDADYVCNSANGTVLNGAEIAKGRITALKPGDVLHIGFWTRIEIQAI
jgi:hypothetical protein